MAAHVARLVIDLLKHHINEFKIEEMEEVNDLLLHEEMCRNLNEEFEQNRAAGLW